MPTLRVMVWNVQCFGDAVPAKGNYAALCDFIAFVAANEEVDVLVMQEVRQGGLAHLNTLSNALDATGGNWYYDFVRSALAVDPGVINPAQFNHTQMDADHFEGYAVFWNEARSAEFVMVAPPQAISRGTNPDAGNLPPSVPARALTLAFRGRDQSGGLNNGWFAAPNFDPNNPNADDVLNFCRSAARIHVGDLAPIGPRRPCVFTLNLNPGGAPNPARFLLPVMVYHATANRRNTRINVQLSGYTRQLYEAYNPADGTWYVAENVLIGGDFNIDAEDYTSGNRDAYGVFVAPFAAGGADADPGIEGEATFGDSPRTTIQLRALRSNTLLTGFDQSAFEKLAIDHFFRRMPDNRPASDVGGYAVDLFDMVINSQNYNGLDTIIQRFGTQITTALGAGRADGGYANYRYRMPGSNTPARTHVGGVVSDPIVGDLANWAYFRRGLADGGFFEVNGGDDDDDARTAAEFLNKLVSDHVPTVFSLDF